jgi:hypothetical protein
METERNLPVLLDAYEVARVVGVKDNQVKSMARKGLFPKPLEKVKGFPAGTWWLGVDVAAWVKEFPSSVSYVGDIEPVASTRKLIIPEQFIVVKNKIVADAKPKEKVCHVSEHYHPAGIYFLVKDKEIVYVGKAKSIQSRLDSHVKDAGKKFDSFWYFECFDKHWRSYLEAHYINELSPALNVVTPSMSTASLPEEAFEYVPH